jgi:hypothetical protein
MRYHKALDILMSAVTAAQQGKGETAGKLFLTASAHPGMRAALRDLDTIHEAAFALAKKEQAATRRQEIASRRRKALAADDLGGEDDLDLGDDDVADEGEELEALLDDVSEDDGLGEEDDELAGENVDQDGYGDDANFSEDNDANETAGVRRAARSARRVIARARVKQASKNLDSLRRGFRK